MSQISSFINRMFFHDFRRINACKQLLSNHLSCHNLTFVNRGSSSLPEPHEETQIPKIYEKFGEIKHIYKFPYIHYCNFIVNLKFYVLPFFVFYAVNLEEAASEGSLDPDSFNVALFIFPLIIIKSCLFALPFINFVAHVYFTPEEDIVISYIDYLGRRVDEKFPKNDLQLQSRETGLLRALRKDSLYVLLISQSTKKVFKINFKHADMFDEDLFVTSFGQIPESAAG